ncbi:hypothetical protein D3C72_708550 [compost metagenome]
MHRVQAQRRQHRHDLVAEVGTQPALLAVSPGVAAEHADTGFHQRRTQRLVPAAVLLVHQLGGALVDGVENGLRAHAIRCRRQAELLRMADRSGTDLEEFIQVGAGDAHETQALQQRHLRVHRLRQHAEVEIQLRQFAVDVQRRVAQRIAVRAHGEGEGSEAAHGVILRRRSGGRTHAVARGRHRNGRRTPSPCRPRCRFPGVRGADRGCA